MERQVGEWSSDGNDWGSYENDIVNVVKDYDCYRYIGLKLEAKCVWGDEGAERQCPRE